MRLWSRSDCFWLVYEPEAHLSATGVVEGREGDIVKVLNDASLQGKKFLVGILGLRIHKKWKSSRRNFKKTVEWVDKVSKKKRVLKRR